MQSPGPVLKALLQRLSSSSCSSIAPALVFSAGVKQFSSIPQKDGSDMLSKRPASPFSQAGFASSSEVSTTEGQNSWSKFRAPYGVENKSSLGPSMYLAIAVFGFSLYLNDMIYHPPRVVTVLGLMMLIMYVRRR